ncbi:hypothetical protein ABZ721_23560 [Streptomyces sp. NPDC006733]|uniref:hypothetical protein n=1 Tax=Streptomyces sp. NPDC006733 TaxID=3155460 RepID=UPI0034119128
MNLAWDILRGSTEQRVTNVGILAVGVIGGVILGVWAYREWRRKQRAALTILLVSGALSIFGDAAARPLVGFHTDAVTEYPVVYQMFDRPISFWLPAAFPLYAAMGYVAYLALDDRWTKRRFLTWVGGLVVIEAVAELIMINFGHAFAWTQNQPLEVLGLGMVWPPTWVMSGMITGALIFFFGRHLNPARQLLLLPLTSSPYFGMMVILSWPTIIAVNSPLAGIATTALGLVTLAGMAALLYVLTTFMEPRTLPGTSALPERTAETVTPPAEQQALKRG